MLPYVLVETEKERWCSPLISISPFGRAFSRHEGLSIDVVPLRIAAVKPSPSVHRLEESAGLFLSMVAFRQCRFRFAWQNDPSAAATRAANFRVARHPTRILQRPLYGQEKAVLETSRRVWRERYWACEVISRIHRLSELATSPENPVLVYCRRKDREVRFAWRRSATMIAALALATDMLQYHNHAGDSETLLGSS
jgi:hypothetical protein